MRNYKLKITTMKTMTTSTTLRTTIFALLTLLFSMPAVYAADYETTMKANIQKLSDAKSLADFTTVANQFERIANAEPAKWQPRYYVAYCFASAVTMNKMEADEIHQQLDVAQKHLDLLEKSFNNESEILVLQAFVYQMRITDMSKGMKYSMLASEKLDEAETLNANNPRIYYLRGMNTFHTPKAFGGGKEKAKPLFEKAKTLFASQQATSTIDPDWGEWMNNQMLEECNKAD
jgi:hypothetical protein